MILSKKRALVKKIKDYEVIIFDLDNTIFNSVTYEDKVFKIISGYLYNRIKVKKKKIFTFLKSKRKKEVLTNSSLNIFNLLIKNNKNHIRYKKECIKIFQNYKLNKINLKKTLYSELKMLKKKNKEMYLVTNGNYNRQLNKIKSLKISKFFCMIYILEKKSEQKPSLSGVKKLKKIIKNKKCIMVGDSKIDKKFALKLSVDYKRFINDF